MNPKMHTTFNYQDWSLWGSPPPRAGVMDKARAKSFKSQMVLASMWRVALEVDDADWDSNGKVAHLAASALEGMDSDLRKELLCEGLDHAVTRDKPSMAMWFIGLGAPESALEGMTKSELDRYQLSIPSTGHIDSRAGPARSWCAMAAANGSWKVLEALEKAGVGSRERAGEFGKLLSSLVESDEARDIYSFSHPWVLGRWAIDVGAKVKSGSGKGEPNWIEAWRPQGVAQQSLAWQAYAQHCCETQSTEALSLLAQRGLPLGSMADRWEEMAANAVEIAVAAAAWGVDPGSRAREVVDRLIAEFDAAAGDLAPKKKGALRV